MSAALFAGCAEFEPVFTGEYDSPDRFRIWQDSDFDHLTTIAAVKDMYIDNGSKPVTIQKP